jgi:hypothetical protein
MRLRLAAVAAVLAGPLLGCATDNGDLKLPAAAQTVQPRNAERHGTDPDRDLMAKAQGDLAVSETAWSAVGYEQRQYGWRLPFADAPKRLIAPSPWRLDNWEEKSPGHFEAKRGPHYFDTVEVDDDGDGKIDGWERHEEPLSDLELVNEEDDSFVWIKTRAIPPGSARRKLELVARDYVDALSGWTTIAQLDLFGRERKRARQLTTLLKSVRETRVGGHRALDVVADIADVDELRVNPRARLGRLRVVVARIGYVVARRSEDEKSAWPSEVVQGRAVWKKTAILVIGSITGLDDDGQRSLVDDLAARVAFTGASTIIETPRPDAPAKPDGSGAAAI